MTRQSLQVVQFIHPGFEYPFRSGESDVMHWKPGNSIHNRKFLLAHGSMVDWKTRRNRVSTPLVFWGEWEGPSVHWQLDSPGKPFPTFIHAPFRPKEWPTRPVQNTDPMVFGEAFVYSNCLQPAFPSLRRLTSGSIVLFGRYSRSDGHHSFGLDTCMVVDRVQSMPSGGDGWGDDLVADAVLRPLRSEGAQSDLTVYFGRPGPVGPFSFFPARPFETAPSLFARPALTPVRALTDVVNPKKNQGIKATTGLSESERDAVWEEIAHQVTEQGCGLGYHAASPPLIAEHRARAAAGGSPVPFAA